MTELSKSQHTEQEKVRQRKTRIMKRRDQEKYQQYHARELIESMGRTGQDRRKAIIED
jgi:hypothetical protein